MFEELEIESEFHLQARLITTPVMVSHGYEVEPGYYCDISVRYGRQPHGLLSPDVEDEYYHEVDLWARKKFSNGLTEELFIEFDGDDTRHQYVDEDGSKRAPLKSSRYVAGKQKANDILFGQWLKKTKPDAILLRINKEKIFELKNNPEELYQYIRTRVKKSIVDFISS